MEARLVASPPEGDAWQFEPKWDGVRALVRRAGGKIDVLSKSGGPLHRFFPEVVEMIEAIEEDCFLLDGEIILPLKGILSFDALQARLHPAPSRIARLARETPAELMLFDCLAVGAAKLVSRPLAEQRARLEDFHRAHRRPGLHLSPATGSHDRARQWLSRSGGPRWRCGEAVGRGLSRRRAGDAEDEALSAELVVEVSYDQLAGRRFGTAPVSSAGARTRCPGNVSSTSWLLPTGPAFRAS